MNSNTAYLYNGIWLIFLLPQKRFPNYIILHEVLGLILKGDFA